MMTVVAIIITVKMQVLQELLPTKGLHYLGPITRAMYQEEAMLGQFILHFTYSVLLNQTFVCSTWLVLASRP